MKTFLLFSVISLSCNTSKSVAHTNNGLYNGKFYSRKDTLIYCQTLSPWVANCYYFYKFNKTSNSGLFEKLMDSDDGQHWYGIGKFTEFKNKIILYSFQLIHTVNYINSDSVSNEKIIRDTTIIQTATFFKDGNTLFQPSKTKNGKIIFAIRN